MSTILDALKKSEQDRKLSELPTLSDMPMPQEQSRLSGLMVGLLVLVIVLLSFLIWALFFDDTTPNDKDQIVLSNDTIREQQTLVDSKTGEPTEQILVNVVSYSQDPAQRFVMVNGKLFREQEFVRTGLKVEEITQDSVVFNLRGKRIERKP